MKCPYCKNDIKGNGLFCEICGQALQAQTQDRKSTQAYWEEYQVKSQKDILYSRSMKEQTKKETQRARNAKMRCFIIFGVILCAIVILIFSHNISNKKELKRIQQQMIGQVYDDSKLNLLTSGDNTDRYVITILNENQLECREGNYRFYLDSDRHICWEENKIYENEIYTYKLSISFFGRVSIHFRGEKHKVEIWDDGYISYIQMYKN